MDIIFDVYRRFFGFQEKLSLTTNTERVIRSIGGRSYADSVLMDDVLVSLSKSVLIIYVPAKGLEKRINEFSSNLGFVIMPKFVGLSVTFKSFHQVHYLFGCRQLLPSEYGSIIISKRIVVSGQNSLF